MAPIATPTQKLGDLSASMPNLRLIGVAMLAAACTLGVQAPAASRPEVHALLNKMQKLVETQQVSNLKVFADAFGGSNWVQVQRDIISGLSSKIEACETVMSTGGVITAFVLLPNDAKADCSKYTQGSPTNEPLHHYLLRIEGVDLPCITFADMQYVASRDKWFFKNSMISFDVEKVFNDGALKWTGENNEGRPAEGAITFNFPTQPMSDPDYIAKLEDPRRCAFGPITISYSVSGVRNR